MIYKTTERGFDLIEFTDLYGAKCSIQKSSLADEECVWVGVNDADPRIMAKYSRKHGIETKETTGWVKYPISPDVLLTTRMHLSRYQVEELIPILQKFVDTGDIN